MPIIPTMITSFVVNILSSFAIDALNSKREKERYTKELIKVVYETINQYKTPPAPAGKSSFLESQFFFDMLLKRISGTDKEKMTAQEFETLFNKEKKNHLNVIEPNIEELDKFLESLCLNIIKKKTKLEGLEINANYKNEIYRIGNRIDEINEQLHIIINKNVIDKYQDRDKKETHKKNRRKNEKNSIITPITDDYNKAFFSTPMGQNIIELKKNKKYSEAISFISNNFQQAPSWNLLIAFLELCDLNSSHDIGANRINIKKKQIRNKPTPIEKQAFNYYEGRILIQRGDYKRAELRYKNNTRKPNIFYISSQFELASLYFRVEEYKLALKKLEEIEKELENQEGQGIYFLKIHTYQYISTLHVVDCIYDCMESIPSNIPICKEKCTEYLEKAEQLFPLLDDANKRKDRQAWSFVLKAFAEEVGNNPQGAKEHYVAAKEMMNEITKSSSTHILMYYARFLRRSNDLDSALEELKLLEEICSVNNRMKIEFSLYEEMAHISELKLDQENVNKNLQKALNCINKEIDFVENKWAIVKRLKTLEDKWPYIDIHPITI